MRTFRLWNDNSSHPDYEEVKGTSPLAIARSRGLEFVEIDFQGCTGLFYLTDNYVLEERLLS